MKLSDRFASISVFVHYKSLLLFDGRAVDCHFEIIGAVAEDFGSLLKGCMNGLGLLRSTAFLNL